MTTKSLHSLRVLFGDKLRVARLSSALTAKEVAKELSVLPHTIHAWESARSSPPFYRLPLLRDLYRISLDWLFDPTPPSEEILIGNYVFFETIGGRRLCGQVVAILPESYVVFTKTSAIASDIHIPKREAKVGPRLPSTPVCAQCGHVF